MSFILMYNNYKCHKMHFKNMTSSSLPVFFFLAIAQPKTKILLWNSVCLLFVCTGCAKKMLPIFESEWLITFSILRHGFHTILQRKWISALEHISYSFPMLTILIQWGCLNGHRKRVFTSLFPSESVGPREYVRIPSLSPNSSYVFLTDV